MHPPLFTLGPVTFYSYGAAMVVGARVDISHGYTTSAGDETSRLGPFYFLTEIRHAFRDGQAVLELVGESGWAWLARWRARRTFHFASGAKNVFQLLQYFAARAGFDLAASGASSAVITSLAPAFQVGPDEDGRSVVRRLLAMVPEVGRWNGAKLELRQVLAADASVYSYDVAGPHVLYAGERVRSFPVLNHARVVGPSAIGESIDFTDLDVVLDQAAVRRDPYGTSTDLGNEAAGDVREALVLTPAGDLVIPPNVGHELWDVITVTASRMGWPAATTARVIGQRLEFDRARQGRFRQTLELGGV